MLISKLKEPPNPQSSHLISQVVMFSLSKPNYILFGSLSSTSIFHNNLSPSSLARAMDMASYLNSLLHLPLYYSFQCSSQSSQFYKGKLYNRYFASPSNRLETKINPNFLFSSCLISHCLALSSLPSGHTGHLGFRHIYSPKIIIIQIEP